MLQHTSPPLRDSSRACSARAAHALRRRHFDGSPVAWRRTRRGRRVGCLWRPPRAVRRRVRGGAALPPERCGEGMAGERSARSCEELRAAPLPPLSEAAVALDADEAGAALSVAAAPPIQCAAERGDCRGARCCQDADARCYGTLLEMASASASAASLTTYGRATSCRPLPAAAAAAEPAAAGRPTWAWRPAAAAAGAGGRRRRLRRRGDARRGGVGVPRRGRAAVRGARAARREGGGLGLRPRRRASGARPRAATAAAASGRSARRRRWPTIARTRRGHFPSAAARTRRFHAAAVAPVAAVAAVAAAVAAAAAAAAAAAHGVAAAHGMRRRLSRLLAPGAAPRRPPLLRDTRGNRYAQCRPHGCASSKWSCRDITVANRTIDRNK